MSQGASRCNSSQITPRSLIFRHISCNKSDNSNILPSVPLQAVTSSYNKPRLVTIMFFDRPRSAFLDLASRPLLLCAVDSASMQPRSSSSLKIRSTRQTAKVSGCRTYTKKQKDTAGRRAEVSHAQRGCRTWEQTTNNLLESR